MKPSFEKTVDILVKAYLNDTLEHSKCTACAVGNLVADALSTAPKQMFKSREFFCWEYDNGARPAWADVFISGRSFQEINPHMYEGDAKYQIDATGYAWPELARIEKAFESAPGRCEDGLDDEWMFNGLMAVVDVLADIHGIDLETKESAKLLFVKA